jgi:outer membrane protein assembly factor BamB
MAPSSAVPVAAADRHLRRKSVPLVALALMLLTWLVLWALPADRFDRGMRSIFGLIAAMIAIVVAGVWFFGLAGISRRTRGIVALCLILLAVGARASVRRVEFSGDMEPTFDFVWQPSREEKLAEYLATEQPAPAPTKEEMASAPATEAAPATPSSDAAAATNPGPEDSPRYRGVNADGVVICPPLARDWASEPPKCLWRHPCGGGYAGYAVIGDAAVTIEQRGGEEAVVCYDLSTGRHRWTHAYPALFSERMGGDGPRATPAIDGGYVYSLGATGELVKLDFATGALVWQVNILAENASGNLDWGMSGSPLVHDGRVIVNPGNQQGSVESADVLAFDAKDGKVALRAGQAKTSYCSPMMATLLGRPQILIFDAAGLAGFDPSNGEQLWRVPWTSDFDINAAQPLVVGDNRIVISSQAGCALIELALSEGHWVATQRWHNRSLKCSYSNFVHHNGHLYGLDEGILVCLNLESGKRLWKDRAGQYGHGQLLLAGDLLVILSEKGELALVEAVPTGFHELGRVQAIEGKTWNNPVLIGNRALVRNHLEMACYELPLAKDIPSLRDQ